MKSEKLLFLMVVTGVSCVGVQAAQQQQKTVPQRLAPIPVSLALERAANDSLGSCKSTASDPTGDFPDPFLLTSVGSEGDVLDSARYGCSLQNVGAEQLIKTAESVSPAIRSDGSSASAGSLHSVHLSSGKNSDRTNREEGKRSDRSDRDLSLTSQLEPNSVNGALESPLLSMESSSRGPVEAHAVPNFDRYQRLALCKPALFYLVLTVLGVLHGGVNKHLSNGAVNRHFYETSWTEWETGAVANTLAGLVLAVGCKLFHPLEPMSPFVRTWFGYPAAMAALFLGQMGAEVIPLPQSAGWRNMAINVWVAPLAFWYAGNGVWRLCSRNKTRSHSRINSVDGIAHAAAPDSHEL